jgi:hypothetical protein
MELQEAWKRLEREKLEKPVLGTVPVRKRSRHPVQKLKSAYLCTTAFSIISLAGFIYLMVTFHEPLVKGSLFLLILGYVFFFVTNLSMYAKIKVALPVDQSLKAALVYTHDFITSNIRFQERVALFIYPVAGTAGFILGGDIGGGNLEKMLTNPIVLVILAGVLVILTPLCFYLTRWMYKVSYGKCLTELKGMIEELERPEGGSENVM